MTAPGALGDPFHPLSAGHHRTDEGLRYQAGVDLGAVDILGPGREIDVSGVVISLGPREPCMLIELNIAFINLDPETAETTGDATAEMLAHRDLHRVRIDDGIPAAGPNGLVWRVLPFSRGHRPPGVYGPGRRVGAPGGRGTWALMSPPPPLSDVWKRQVAAAGYQVGLFVTTHTHLAHLGRDSGPVTLAALRAEGAAGRLYGARAVVLPWV